MLNVPEQVLELVSAAPEGVAALAANCIVNADGSRLLIIVANPLAAEHLQKGIDKLRVDEPDAIEAYGTLSQQLGAALRQRAPLQRTPKGGLPS